MTSRVSSTTERVGITSRINRSDARPAAMWCDYCGYHVTKEYLEEEECPYLDCPAPLVGVDDELRKVLGEALTSAKGTS